MSMSRRKPQVETHLRSDFFHVPMARQVMACPLDQQGRDYMLDLIVQISEDHVGPLSPRVHNTFRTGGRLGSIC